MHCEFALLQKVHAGASSTSCLTIFIVRNSSCGKVIFSQVCVKNSVARGVCVMGAYMVGGMLSKGLCMVGGMHGTGSCMASGMHGREVCIAGGGEHEWQGAFLKFYCSKIPCF